MTPKLRFPLYNQRFVKKSINEILTIGSGKDYKHLSKGEIPVYGTGGLMTTVNDHLYDGESVGIGRKGTIDKPIFLKGKFWTVDTLFYTHSFEDVDPYYVFTLFQQINWKKYNEASGVPSLSKTTVGAIQVYVPRIEEQLRIRSLFEAVDQKINLLTKKKEALETYKKGLMQKIFSQELRFKRDDGTDYPKWDCQPLGDLAYVTSGKSNREDSDTDAKYHFFDRSSDVRRSGIYLFDDDAVIVAGEGQEFIPKKYSGKFDLHQRAYAIMKFGERLSYKYCYYFIFHHRRYFEKMAVGTTVLSLRLPMFEKMQIQLPSMEEQNKIVAVFTNLDTYLKKVSYSIQSTESLKKGLLQQMFV